MKTKNKDVDTKATPQPAERELTPEEKAAAAQAEQDRRNFWALEMRPKLRAKAREISALRKAGLHP
jgi:hypothetical protein